MSEISPEDQLQALQVAATRQHIRQRRREITRELWKLDNADLELDIILNELFPDQQAAVDRILDSDVPSLA